MAHRLGTFLRLFLAACTWGSLHYSAHSLRDLPRQERGLPSRERAEAVRQATRDTWLAYEKWALGFDELNPISREGSNSLGGLGASAVDALSTLHITGLTEEYSRARDWVVNKLNFDRDASVSLFETIIRVSGGLLSAHDLTGDPALLAKARDLADRLAPTYLTCPETGIPDNAARLPFTHPGACSGIAVLAELGSATLEWGALSLRSGNATYRRLVEAPVRRLWEKHQDKGLLADQINMSTGAEASSRLSVGAASDSTYEYLLKHWLLLGKQDDWWRQRWVSAMDDAVDRLVRRTPDGSLVWVSDLSSTDGSTSSYLEHLACFWPGNLVLGVLTGAVSGSRARRYTDVAAAVTQACYELYAQSPTGLAWDEVHVNPLNGSFTPAPTQRGYLQRPEVLESIFYMHRLTGDPKYQDWAWKIFTAIQKYSKVQGSGYTGLQDPGQVPPSPDNMQQSFLLAETFKYLYLLFEPPFVLPLEEWVLTTEAHPLQITRPSSSGGVAGLLAGAAAGMGGWPSALFS